MNRVPPLEVELVYEPTPDGQERLQRTYDRLIEMAIRNLEQRGVDKRDSNKS